MIIQKPALEKGKVFSDGQRVKRSSEETAENSALALKALLIKITHPPQSSWINSHDSRPLGRVSRKVRSPSCPKTAESAGHCREQTCSCVIQLYVTSMPHWHLSGRNKNPDFYWILKLPSPWLSANLTKLLH